jgi:hypothetical protein
MWSVFTGRASSIEGKEVKEAVPFIFDDFGFIIRWFFGRFGFYSLDHGKAIGGVSWKS